MFPRKGGLHFWSIFGTFFFGVLGFGGYEIGKRLAALGVYFSLNTFWWPVMLLSCILAAAGLIFVWTNQFRALLVKFSGLHSEYFPQDKRLLWALFLVFAFGYAYWVIFISYLVLDGFWVRTYLFLSVSVLGMLIIQPLVPERNWKIALAGSILVMASILRVMIYVPELSTSPFSLSWSEGSRYYYGSIFFSRRVYGIDLPLISSRPSRYLLLSLPFLFTDSPIWAHRLWQVLLWLGMTGWTGFLLAKRVAIKNRSLFLLFMAWFFCFIQVGPVYYHLLICVILVFLGTDFSKPLRTFVFLILASIWAGLSRINWIPVPLFLVVMLYFLERPKDDTQNLLEYLRQPLLWSTSIVVAQLSFIIYLKWIGSPSDSMGSSFTSALLWNRLWPNPTYPYGILLGILMVSVPLWLLLAEGLSKDIHPVKKTAYLMILAILLAGGIVVSVKIGGGSNLHNLDAYLVVLATLSSYVFWEKMALDCPYSQVPRSVPEATIGVTLAILVPVFFTLQLAGPITLPDLTKDWRDLDKLQQIVFDSAQQGGEILFISERQLLVFDYIPTIPHAGIRETGINGNDHVG